MISAKWPGPTFPILNSLKRIHMSLFVLLRKDWWRNLKMFDNLSDIKLDWISYF